MQAIARKAKLQSAAYANGYNPLIAWGKSIGYRPNQLKYANRSNQQNIAEDFLINSYTTRNDFENHGSLEQYACDSELMMLSMMERRDHAGMKSVLLPESIPLDLSLGAAIVRRRSVATYTGDSISLRQLATVLRAAYGISIQAVVRSNSGESIPINLRTVASGGGLYPLTLLVLALNVNQLPRAVYEYSSSDDVLYQVKDANSVNEILKTYAVSDELVSFSRANYICLIVANGWKSMRKYGNKGLRFVLQEIGALTQNIHLANVALGLAGTDCAAYYEHEMNKLFHYDGINQSILHTVISGINN